MNTIEPMKPGSIRQLPNQLGARAGRTQWPTDYIVWDLETTGLSHKDNHIVEIGAITVEGNQITGAHRWVLDNGVPVNPVAAAMNGITDEVIAEEGRDAADCMSEFLTLLTPGNQPHLTHNGYKFDIPWLVHHAAVLLNLPADQEQELMQNLHDTMIDTAALIKGEKLSMNRQWNESTVDHARRVMPIMAKGVKYNVTLLCAEMNIDMEGITTHSAGGDVILTNEIYQRIVNPILHGTE